MNDFTTQTLSNTNFNSIMSGGSSSLGVKPKHDDSALPCLFSNISTENKINSSQFRKSANALSWNVQFFSQRFGLENLGFLTLTFKDHVICVKEAQRRLNSLLTHEIKPRYNDYVGVLERQKNERIHFHFLINVGHDIRTHFDFDAIAKKNYSSASNQLRDEWAYWRKTAPKYGFGRTELLPVRSSSEAIGRYVGKYIGKHMESRKSQDKNARLVRYSKDARVCTTRFMFLTEGSSEWRSKVRTFAEIVSSRTGKPPTFETLREVLGPRWAHNHRDYISSLPVLG